MKEKFDLRTLEGSKRIFPDLRCCGNSVQLLCLYVCLQLGACENQ